MPKQGSKKLNVVPPGKQQAKQLRGEAVRVKLLDAAAKAKMISGRQ